MAVITISRQYGSGDDEIAARLCKVLGYHFFDKRLMAQVAAEVGLLPTEVVDFSEDNYEVRSLLERLFGRYSSRGVTQSGPFTKDTTAATVKVLTPAMGIFSYEFPDRLEFQEAKEPDEVKSITFIRAATQAAYKHGNVVIVGRGGQAILKDKLDVLHVRIVAPIEARMQYLHERENFNLNEAHEIAIKRDQASAEYLKRFYGIDWADPLLYDLIINTVKLDVEGATQLIVNAVQRLPVIKPT